MRASGGGRLWRSSAVAVAVVMIFAVGVQAERNPAGPQIPLAPDWASAADPAGEFAERSADVSEAVKLAESADHEVTQARGAGRVSVLVYMEPTLSRHAVKRADVRQFGHASSLRGVLRCRRGGSRPQGTGQARRRRRVGFSVSACSGADAAEAFVPTPECRCSCAIDSRASDMSTSSSAYS